MQTIALDPRFSSRKSQEYIYGTATGTLVLSSRGWLGQSETVLFQGRGKVHAVRMAGTLLAWVTDTGLRVYDTSNHSRVGRIDRPGPSGAGTAAAECCSLEWVGQRELLLGWGAHVMAVAVTRRSTPQAGATPPQAQPSPGNSALPMGSAPAVWQLETTCCFPSDEGLVAGVAPFGSQLAVLVWNPPGTSNGIDSADDALEDGNGSIEPSSSGVTLRNGVSIVAPSSPATLKIYDRRGQELFSDAVELARLDASPAATCPVHLSAYVGAFSPPPRPPAGDAHSAVHPEAATPRPIQTRQRVEQPYKWWADGEEPLYYILGGKDIAIGRPRNSADRIAWLAERNRFPEAMAVADADREVGPAARLALGERYLQYLLSQKRYSEAAALCPSLLGKDAAAWERWVYEFAQVAKLALLAPHLPVADPQLSMSAYDLALNACLRATDGEIWQPSLAFLSACLCFASKLAR